MRYQVDSTFVVRCSYAIFADSKAHAEQIIVEKMDNMRSPIEVNTEQGRFVEVPDSNKVVAP